MTAKSGNKVAHASGGEGLVRTQTSNLTMYRIGCKDLAA